MSFVTREDAIVTLLINSKLGTCKPVYPFEFNCGDDQGLAELLTRHLNDIITTKFQKVAKVSYARGFHDAKAKRKYNDDTPDIPWSFA